MRRVRFTPAAGLAALAAAVVVARARADDAAWRPRATLVVERDSGASACADAAELRGTIAARLGYDPVVERQGDVALAVRFTKAARGFEALVRATDASGAPKGEKKLASQRSDCSELAEAVTLTIAILLDPQTGLVARPPEGKPEPEPFIAPTASAPASASPAGPPRPPETTETTPAASTLVPHVRGAVLGAIGSAPAPTAGARVGGGIGATRWSVDAELRADLPRAITLDGNRVSSGLVLAGVVPCFRGGIVEACLVAAAGSLRTEAARATPSDASSFHAVAGARAGVLVPLTTALALELAADMLIAITRTRVRIDGAEVWATPFGSASAAAGLELRIP